MTFRPAGAARGKAGRDGHEGSDGVNAIPADDFIASRINDEGSATREALDALYTGAEDDGAAKVFALAVGAPVPSTIGHRDVIVRF